MKRLILTILIVAVVALFTTTAVASKGTMKCGKCPQQMAANTAEAPASDSVVGQADCCGKQNRGEQEKCQGGKCQNCQKQGKKMHCKAGEDCPKKDCGKKMKSQGGENCPKEGCGKKMKCRGGEGCNKENCAKQGKKMKCRGAEDCSGKKDCPKQS